VASEELGTLLELLKTNNPMAGDTIPELRASMAAATDIAPVPEDVRFEPIEIGGLQAEWAEAPGAAADRVLLYLHGGGYGIGSIASHRQLAADLSRAAALRVLSLEYRLAPEHPYPAAVDDALAGYRFLLSAGFAPERIAVAGDSAGGGLTAATLIALRDAGDALPAAGVCISPWLDLTQSSATYDEKEDVDPLVSRALLDLFSDAYLAGQDAELPTASPLFAKLEGLPPLLVQVGTAEVLLDDSRRFAERAKEAGVEVELEVWDDMIHVWHCFALLLPEGRSAIQRIAGYLGEKLAS
jgi:monoterpene epsilon-lactone hydrolase